MSDLTVAMALLMKVFDKYASVDGDPKTLNKAEVKNLLTAELPGLEQAIECKDMAASLIKDLDINSDDKLDFTEFMVLVTALSCILKD
ncbi:protein S100-P-like [Synchiropus splendidus]|uniref:protein S100-P-like n=1 Tax=Synchiropus splendidus TaxID=270530 RepID=UPI00237E8563|nr:protein S100-P-like [Synchiropus splendidus]